MDITLPVEQQERIAREGDLLASAQAREVGAELQARWARLTARIQRLTSEYGTDLVEGMHVESHGRAARERARRLATLNDMLGVIERLSAA